MSKQFVFTVEIKPYTYQGQQRHTIVVTLDGVELFRKTGFTSEAEARQRLVDIYRVLRSAGL